MPGCRLQHGIISRSAAALSTASRVLNFDADDWQLGFSAPSKPTLWGGLCRSHPWRHDLSVRRVSRHRPHQYDGAPRYRPVSPALESLGYRGWRYDMVHGYRAKWIAQYNSATRPTFSVGEHDWDKQSEQRGWVWVTATTPGDRPPPAASSTSRLSSLKNNKGN